VRCGAILAIDSIGTAAIDSLILALKDPFPLNSDLAAESLGRIGPDAARAIPALKQAKASSILRAHQKHLQEAIDAVGQTAP
jgi:hypothetical protein